MKTLYLCIFFLVATLVSACASDGKSCTALETADGVKIVCKGDEQLVKNGAACTIKNEDDISTIVCPDGTATALEDGKDGSSCRVEKNGETTLIVCTDGSMETVTSLQGPPGDKGDTGTSALIATSDESAGANCSFGGTRIDVGVDTNNDGVLSQDEVTNTSFVCNATGAATGTLYGDVLIGNSHQLREYVQYQHITGKLTINAAAGEFIEFPALETVGGLLVQGGDPTLSTSVSFPRLTTVRGDLHVTYLSGAREVGVASLTAPLLEEVGKLTLNVESLQLVDFSSLRTVADALRLNELSVEISTSDFPNLEFARWLVVYHCPEISCEESAALCAQANVAAGDCYAEEYVDGAFVDCVF